VTVSHQLQLRTFCLPNRGLSQFPDPPGRYRYVTFTRSGV